MPGAIVGYKTKVEINDGGGGTTFAEVLDTVSVSLPKVSFKTVDTTPLNTTDGYPRMTVSPVREIAPGKLELFFTPANFDRFVGLGGKRYQAPDVTTKFRFSSPDPDGAGTLLGKVITFDAFVVDVGEITFSKGTDAIQFSVEYQSTGPWDIAAAPQGTGNP